MIQGQGKYLPIRRRKKRASTQTLDDISITEEHEKEIRKFVKGRCQLGKGTKIPAICRHLRQTFTEEGRPFPPWVVQYHLKNHMGWEYKKLNAVSYDLNSEKAQKQFMDFAYRLNYYLKLEEQGKAKCVYLDETYLNEGHHDPWGWMDPHDRSGDYTLNVKHKGRRIIAIDAITIDGRLTDDECTREQELLDMIKSNKALPSPDSVFETGLMVWSQNEAASEISDYHKTMDSDMFCKYIENRVYPAFKKKYKLWETLKKLSRAEGKHEYYHFVIFTPPYRCRCQPTEVQWNFVKIKAAEELTNESTYRDILAAWVVGTLEVEDQFCTNWVKKSTKYCTDTYQAFSRDEGAVIGELKQNPWKEPAPHSGDDDEGKSEEAGELVLDVSGEAAADDSHGDVEGDENATEVSELREYGIDDDNGASE